MKKRVLSMAMATVMAASLTACGSGSTATTAAPTETNADTSAAASEAASEAAGSSDADVQKIIDRGVLKVGCKSDVPNFSLQNTATGEYEGFEDDLAYEIAGEIFGCSADEAKEKKLVEFQGVTEDLFWKTVRLTWLSQPLRLQRKEKRPTTSPHLTIQML